MLVKQLAFTSIYFSESGLFNGLRSIQIKKFPSPLSAPVPVPPIDRSGCNLRRLFEGRRCTAGQVVAPSEDDNSDFSFMQEIHSLGADPSYGSISSGFTPCVERRLQRWRAFSCLGTIAGSGSRPTALAPRKGRSEHRRPLVACAAVSRRPRRASYALLTRANTTPTMTMTTATQRSR
jgi:hypothetical protein